MWRKKHSEGRYIARIRKKDSHGNGVERARALEPGRLGGHRSSSEYKERS